MRKLLLAVLALMMIPGVTLAQTPEPIATPPIDLTISLGENLRDRGLTINESYGAAFLNWNLGGRMQTFDFLAISFASPEEAAIALPIVLRYSPDTLDANFIPSEVPVGKIGDESIGMLLWNFRFEDPWIGFIAARSDNVVVVGRAEAAALDVNPVYEVGPYVQWAIERVGAYSLPELIPTYDMFPDGRYMYFAGDPIESIPELPTPTPSPTTIPTATQIPTPRPTSTPRPTATPSPVPTATPSPVVEVETRGFTLTGQGDHIETINIERGSYNAQFSCDDANGKVDLWGDAIRYTTGRIANFMADSTRTLTLDSGELHVAVRCSGPWALIAVRSD